MIYLDNCATTKPDAQVIEIINKCLLEDYGNPSSKHTLGINAKKYIAYGRDTLSKLINSSSEQVIFTSVATESNNMAINSFIKQLSVRGNRIICSGFEHPSIKRVYESYADMGYDVVFVETDSQGILNYDKLLESINDETILLSLIYVNNNTGAISDFSRIIPLVREKSKWAKIHIDAVQALGKIDIDVKNIDCDSMSFSAHKLYGPKGVGALYVKNPKQFKPFLLGGGQEMGLRSGTENVPAVAGFGKACEIAKENIHADYEYVNEVREYTVKLIGERIDEYIINTPLEYSSPYVLNISFKNVLGEVILNELSKKEIYISTGSACSSNGQSHDESLKTMRLTKEYADGTIRIGFSKHTTREDVDVFVSCLADSVKFVRGIVRKK